MLFNISNQGYLVSTVNNIKIKYFKLNKFFFQIFLYKVKQSIESFMGFFPIIIDLKIVATKTLRPRRYKQA